MKTNSPLLLFLGTGTGTPLASRLPSSLLCQYHSQRILIDIGAGILNRLAEVDVPVAEIDLLYLTHFHADHVGDLETLLFMLSSFPPTRSTPLQIVGGPGLHRFIQQLLISHRLPPYTHKSPYFLIEVIPGASLDVLSPIHIQTAAMFHKPESIGYRFSFDSDFHVVYSGDTQYTPSLIALSQNADLLICEASFPSGHAVKGHLTPEIAGTIATQSNASALALTHFYPAVLRIDIEKECQKTYSKQIIVPNDGTQITWSRTKGILLHEILSNQSQCL